MHIAGIVSAQRDCDGDRPGAHSQRKRQTISSLLGCGSGSITVGFKSASRCRRSRHPVVETIRPPATSTTGIDTPKKCST